MLRDDPLYCILAGNVNEIRCNVPAQLHFKLGKLRALPHRYYAHCRTIITRTSAPLLRAWWSDHKDPLPGSPDPLEEVRHDEGQHHRLLQEGLSLVQSYGPNSGNIPKIFGGIIKLTQFIWTKG